MVESLNIVNQIIGDKLDNIKNSSFTRDFQQQFDVLNVLFKDSDGNVKNVNRRNTKILKFLVKEKKNLKSYDFLKMINVLMHFKKWTSGAKKLRRNISLRSVESPKGEFAVTIVGADSSTPFRCKIRSPSYYNLRLISKLGKGHYLADLVTLIGTIDIVFGEVDR